MKPIPVLGALVAALAFAPQAMADSPTTTAFGGAVSCITRPAGDATAGQRWCEGDGIPHNVSDVASFDGTPIDVGVAFPPAPASGPDGNFPVVGIYHGYGSSKILASDANTAQRWLQQGYAVFTMTDRGFYGSCGPYTPSALQGNCSQGHIHLMSNAYEVHDAQYFLGMLADEGLINPNQIGANGGSYGGGMAMALATLNNRTQLTDGSLVPWTSPGGIPMHIAAAIPEYSWSDLIASLQPNGSTLDYAAENPYAGPNGDRRFGIQKAYWNGALYQGGALAGTYAAPGSDPTADISTWFQFNNTGGPYDGQALAAQQEAEFPNHASAAIDSSVAPAPMLITNGWNDDLFPVDEGVRMYNRIRDLHPTAPIQLYDINYGHSPRSGDSPPVGDVGKLYLAESAWFSKYVKGNAAAPVADPVGGVTVSTSACDATGAVTNGVSYHATTWAGLSQGEIRVDSAAAQTIAPGTQPAAAYQTGAPSSPTTSVCTTGPTTDTSGAAIYSAPAAPTGGYTIMGASTVIADLGVTGANDQVIGRLYDVDPSANTERLIGRSIYRPTGVGSTSRQVFQLHPQAWNVAAGHVVKLELLSSDAPHARPATGQQPVTVSNLELRIPTVDQPGAAGGLVQAPADKVLPAGYTLARDLIPVTSPIITPPVGPITTPITTNPAPVVVPSKDALTATAARAALGQHPTGVKTTKTRTSVSFTDSIPEAGVIGYTLSIDVKKGKHTHRYTLGKALKTVLASGKVNVKITITKSRRSLLKAHPKTKLVLTTTFTTSVLHDQLGTTRKFTAKVG